MWRAIVLLLLLAAGGSLAACGPADRGGGDGLADAGDATADAGFEPDAGAADPCDFAAPPPDTRPLPEEVRTAVADLELHVSSGPVEIWVRRSSTLSEAQRDEFRARSCEALAFDLRLVELDATAPALRRTMRVVVLDDRSYGRATGAPGTYGVAFSAWEGDGDALVLPESSLRDLPELDDTLAHELTHVVQDRMASDSSQFPWYFIEGLAIAAGSMYGKEQHGRPTGFVRPWIEQATGADARITWERYGLEDRTQDLGEVGHDQSLSGFFVEYLRVKREGGRADAPARLLRTMMAASAGERFSGAFSSRFGFTLTQAREGYAAFLDATVGDDAARFGGTVYE